MNSGVFFLLLLLKYTGHNSSSSYSSAQLSFQWCKSMDSSVDFQLKVGIWLKRDGLGKTSAFLILVTSSLELCKQECPFETGHTTTSKSKEPICTYVNWVYRKGRTLIHRSHPESAWFWDRSVGSSLGVTFKKSALYWFPECLVIQLETLWLYLSIRLRKLCLRRYPMKFSLVGMFKVQPSQLIDRRKTDW